MGDRTLTVLVVIQLLIIIATAGAFVMYERSRPTGVFAYGADIKATKQLAEETSRGLEQLSQKIQGCLDAPTLAYVDQKKELLGIRNELMRLNDCCYRILQRPPDPPPITKVKPALPFTKKDSPKK